MAHDPGVTRDVIISLAAVLTRELSLHFPCSSPHALPSSRSSPLSFPRWQYFWHCVIDITVVAQRSGSINRPRLTTPRSSLWTAYCESPAHFSVCPSTASTPHSSTPDFRFGKGNEEGTQKNSKLSTPTMNFGPVFSRRALVGSGERPS